jgi:hypothetical protein
MSVRKLKSSSPSVVAGKIESNGCGIAGHSSRRSNEAFALVLLAFALGWAVSYEIVTLIDTMAHHPTPSPTRA